MKRKIIILALGAGLLIFFASIWRTFWGITHLYKYLTYDNHSWGTIIYRSDKMDVFGNYKYNKYELNSLNADHINMQMILDEEVDGTDRFSITFKDYRSRTENYDYYGGRSVAVYNNFYNSDGDIITKIDIIIDVISFAVLVLYIIFSAIIFKWMKRRTKE